jgi:hypothetical protein
MLTSILSTAIAAIEHLVTARVLFGDGDESPPCGTVRERRGGKTKI